MHQQQGAAPAFLTGGGEVGALMRAHDGSASALGAPGSWPQSLSSVLGLLLNTTFPMFVAEVPQLNLLLLVEARCQFARFEKGRAQQPDEAEADQGINPSANRHPGPAYRCKHA